MNTRNRYKFYCLVMCAVFAIFSAAPFEYAKADDETDAVYKGFAGMYQHVYAEGHKLRVRDDKIIADETSVNDMSV